MRSGARGDPHPRASLRAGLTRLVFLGTGASGGTPGRGRSGRRESSLLVEHGGHRLLIDVTRHFSEQMAGRERLDAILLTHAHRDASGGMAKLRAWWSRNALPRIPVLAHPSTIATLGDRFSRLDHCSFRAIVAGERRRQGPWAVEALEVPHDPRFPTYAWRLEEGGAAVVYASDVARPTHELARFCRGCRLLAADGATYRRRIFSHLRIDEDLPLLCAWDVGAILLTQIGRSAPPHHALEGIVQDLCPKACPAYDGMAVSL